MKASKKKSENFIDEKGLLALYLSGYRIMHHRGDGMNLDALIVGLGNHGEAYCRHRHNAGFRMVRALIEARGLPAPKMDKKFDSLMTRGTIGDVRAIVLQPQTYMNRSGEAVKKVMDYFDLDAQRLYVIHDDLDLACGQIKVKSGGGTAGHNGLRSLDAHVGSKDYHRLRVGIGCPPHKEDVARYVLHDFAKEDEEWLVPCEEKVSKEFPLWITQGDEALRRQLQNS